jgi:hypothetical protein
MRLDAAKIVRGETGRPEASGTAGQRPALLEGRSASGRLVIPSGARDLLTGCLIASEFRIVVRGQLRNCSEGIGQGVVWQIPRCARDDGVAGAARANSLSQVVSIHPQNDAQHRMWREFVPVIDHH